MPTDSDRWIIVYFKSGFFMDAPLDLACAPEDQADDIAVREGDVVDWWEIVDEPLKY